jgi:hypothetical protein
LWSKVLPEIASTITPVETEEERNGLRISGCRRPPEIRL